MCSFELAWSVKRMKIIMPKIVQKKKICNKTEAFGLTGWFLV